METKKMPLVAKLPLDVETNNAVTAILKRGDRIMMVPVKDGARIFEFNLKEIVPAHKRLSGRTERGQP